MSVHTYECTFSDTDELGIHNSVGLNHSKMKVLGIIKPNFSGISQKSIPDFIQIFIKAVLIY